MDTNWGKWTFGEEVPQVFCAHPPIFLNRHLGPQVPIYPSAHFALSVHVGKMGAIKVLRYFFLPKVLFSSKPQVPIFPFAHLQKFWVNGHRAFGVPL